MTIQSLKHVDVSSLTSLSEVAQYLHMFEEKEKRYREQLSDLLAKESIEKGIFYANEIHTLKQERMAIEFQVTFLRARKKRLEQEDI